MGPKPRHDAAEQDLFRMDLVNLIDQRHELVKLAALIDWPAFEQAWGPKFDMPIDNNWVENRIRPIALGRQNWLFAGCLRAGSRAAAVMSLVHSAKLNGLEPHAYLRDVLERLPTQPARRIEELLPHRWATAAS